MEIRVLLGSQLIPQLAHMARRKWWSCEPTTFTHLHLAT